MTPTTQLSRSPEIACRSSANERVRRQGLVVDNPHSHALVVFVLTEAQAAEIRTAYEQHGEVSAVVELRRLFPGLGDIAWARECVRTIAGWQPPLTRSLVMPLLTERGMLRKPRRSRDKSPTPD